MTDNRAGGTRLLVTTMLAAVAVGAALLVDAYMQDDLHDPVAAAGTGARAAPGDEGVQLDPRAACWGPFLPQFCTPPLIPGPDLETGYEHSASNEPVAAEPARLKQQRHELPPIDLGEENPVALSDKAFKRVIDDWHAPKVCATQVGRVSGTPTVRVELDIAKDGRVTDVRAKDVDDITEQELASCLQERARGLRFPPREVHRETTRDATFVF